MLNAVEYTPKGKTVYLEGKMTDNGWQVCVRDEGIGFDEEAVRHAAERLKSPAGQMDTMVWGCGQPHRQSAHTKENWY